MSSTGQTFSLRYGLTWACLLALGCARAVLAAEVSQDNRASQRLTSPVYGPESSRPIAVLRVEATRTEYQRRGFFRIGALPLLVAEQVRIEVRDPQATAEVFAGLPEWLRAPGKGRAGELRDFQMRGPEPAGVPWLTVARVRLAEHGQWELKEGCLRSPTGEVAHFDQALMQIAGRHTGRITLADGRNFTLLPSVLSLTVPTRTQPGTAATEAKPPAARP